MKLAPRLVLAFGLFVICRGICPAADKPADQPDKLRWNVRVEVLMVALPQDKALAMLPDLRDSKKIDEAMTQILALIGKKEAILTGYPVVQTIDGSRGVAESILEKRYATEYQEPDPPPPAPVPDSKPIPPPKPGNEPPGGGNPSAVPQPTSKPPEARPAGSHPSPMPTAFETRNMGVTLEVAPVVSPAGDTISLDLVPQRVDLYGFDYVDAASTPQDGKLQIGQPQFLTTKDTITMSVKNGEHVLVGVHPLVKPAGYIELFIVQAVATPIK